MALMAQALLGAMAAALLSVGGSEVQIAANHLRATQTHFVAEAGLEDAFNSFRNTPSLLVAAPPGLTNVPGLAGPGTVLDGFGTYTVQYQSGGVNTVLVVSTGTSGDALRVLRATLSTAFSPTDAIRVGRDLNVSGDMHIDGTCGNVHANGNVTVSGNPEVSGSATASGTWQPDDHEQGNIGGEWGGERPARDIPSVKPSYFLAAAKALLPPSQVYQMKADGRVLDGNDNVIASLASANPPVFQGWQYTAGAPPGAPPATLTRWNHVGNVGFDGTYFLEGNVVIGDNPGTAEAPWSGTVIATGDIEVSGNPVMSPHLIDTAFVAGLDLKINGNASQSFTGLFAAHEQVDISGNPVVNGYILAEDAPSTSETVKDKESRVSGSMVLIYNCSLNSPLAASLAILAWGL